MLPKPRFAESTRERILRAAGEVFAELGFRDTTVREICHRAQVNIAAVNYHFRNKQALYGEVLAFAFRESNDRYPLTVAADPLASPDGRLSDFIQTFFRRLMDDGPDSWQGRLTAREIMDPTAALDRVVETWIRPRFELLHDILPRLVPTPCDHSDIERCLLSIIGQCLVYRHSRSVIDRLCPEIIRGPEEIERTAAHVAQFCLAALKHRAANPASVQGR
jgi:AcrR family transcriptional regulator